ncbi:sodium-translocating pyrophosphatase [Candidatus Bathyarchaeota archaeon ex4484_205]|nr:MAG: sodium-translocating pyrophosphatase [Candidatus Bathyarchaeota archaeon ex4484_205]
MDPIILLPISALSSLLMAAFLAYRVLREPPGTPKMIKISEIVHEGAKTYLVQQYKAVYSVGIPIFLILLVVALHGIIDIFIPYAFIHGLSTCALAGFIGMMISTKASSRTAKAAEESLNSALRVAFRSGAVMGLSVIGIVLMDISIWYALLNLLYPGLSPVEKALKFSPILISSVFGTSFMAFFARVGGGIYTKAADIGADLVGKVEEGIPEDDPRNPAVIADNVGDNVGDVAGMGADLHESFASATLAAAALGASSLAPYGLAYEGMLVPLLIMAAGVFASIAGILAVRLGRKEDQKALLNALRKGIFTTSLLIVIFSFLVIYFLLGPQFIGLFIALILGLLAGLVIGLSSEYFTSHAYGPTKRIAESSRTGPATVIINGLAVGMESIVIPIIVVAFFSALSFYVAGGVVQESLGLFGVSLTAVGMLSSLGMTLSTDAYGPVADNAGGLAKMADLPPIVRERTDALDAIGNTTAAVGKGFAIASGATTVLALISEYRELVSHFIGSLSLSLMDPIVIAGLLVGASTSFLFCAVVVSAVGNAAQKMVEEVRRQFREIPGLREGKASPDYSRCIKISTVAAQKELLKPGIIAVIIPLLIGFILGVKAVVALLVGALVTAFALALMMANSGAAWDNAKKYIESGYLGGEGSFEHKAAVIGDTVGDPLKDSAGPSLDGLIKLMSTVSIVSLPIVIMFSLL